MIVGDPKVFAIEAEITHPVDPYWVHGHLHFWVCDEPVGDWDDLTALQICAGRMRDFLENPIDRNEPQLYARSKTEIFQFYDSYMRGKDYLDRQFGNVSTRFNIVHLGMSTFDRYDLLLMEDGLHQRILWRTDDMGISEAEFDAGTIQECIKQFLKWFEYQS